MYRSCTSYAGSGTPTISVAKRVSLAAFRAVLKDDHEGYTLGRHIAGQLPYYYRTVEGIVTDFASQNSALEAVLDLVANIPTSPKFRNSHCGEVLASHFVESKLGYRRLYSKLTMTNPRTQMHTRWTDCL